MAITDIHIHTKFSADSKESPENYIAEARRRGIHTVGFSDHCDYDMFLAGDGSSLLDDKAYFAALDDLRAENTDVKILSGVELGYAVGTEEYYGKLLAARPFDYAIISVHGVKGRGDCYYPAYFDGLEKREAYELYLNAVLSGVTSDVDFQVLGHLGYVVRYAPYPDKRLCYSEFAPVFDNILKAVIERGAALELNTRTANDNVCVTDISVIKRYVELGGRYFSFGSDAHAVKYYEAKKEEAKRLLRELGAEYTVHFENRRIVKDNL